VDRRVSTETASADFSRPFPPREWKHPVAILHRDYDSRSPLRESDLSTDGLVIESAERITHPIFPSPFPGKRIAALAMTRDLIVLDRRCASCKSDRATTLLSDAYFPSPLIVVSICTRIGFHRTPTSRGCPSLSGTGISSMHPGKIIPRTARVSSASTRGLVVSAQIYSDSRQVASVATASGQGGSKIARRACGVFRDSSTFPKGGRCISSSSLPPAFAVDHKIPTVLRRTSGATGVKRARLANYRPLIFLASFAARRLLHPRKGIRRPPSRSLLVLSSRPRRMLRPDWNSSCSVHSLVPPD